MCVCARVPHTLCYATHRIIKCVVKKNSRKKEERTKKRQPWFNIHYLDSSNAERISSKDCTKPYNNVVNGGGWMEYRFKTLTLSRSLCLGIIVYTYLFRLYIYGHGI